MISYEHDAIYLLYPSVISIVLEKAFDKNENEVEVDMDAVAIKAAELEIAEQTKAQATADAKQSALDKLMALGLTEEEALALGVKK
jgi:DNA-binding transcriptional regulator YhcF (GntR family)